MTRREHYAEVNPDWDGTCYRCGHNYFDCADREGEGCTCLSCAIQYQDEVEQGLEFEPEGN